ncbi:cytoplasmic protein [Schizopora paradoxa]|uniref:Cytoplasmic protein n=1 Tax=Schizopora paradoxa TaxID=27342 RepID=A0A0H2S864_9AGAM|nr:cytoplasmic protein [Schizopora paradoxa]
MDFYTTSFTYPRVSASSQHIPPSPLDFAFRQNQLFLGQNSFNVPQDNQATAADAETLQKVVLSASQANTCVISFAKSSQGKGWNFYVSGVYQQHRATIKLTRSEVLDLPSSNPAVKPEVRSRLDDIAAQTNVRIAVVNSPGTTSLGPPDAIASDSGWSGLETDRVCELSITGNNADGVEVAKVHLLVMIDELSGLQTDYCEIDHKLHPIIAGRRRNTIQTIQEETGTNIYFPSPFHGLNGIAANGAVPAADAVARDKNIVWITGEYFGVKRAKDMLFQLSLHKSKVVMSRDSAILPRKLDWMLTDRMDDLKSIMNDNATFLNVPPIGSSNSLITVYGDNKVNIQRTIRTVMQLACQFYVASLWLLPVQFNVLLPPSTLNPSQISTVLKQIADVSGAEVVFKSMCFEMHGLEHEVRAAIQMILELDAIKVFHHEIRFQIELANEHREFISGKKNGKINKIMQTTGVKIKFETFNEHNFLIDISSNNGAALQGLALLQEELPAEISFHVPEAYHKRIIGVGGKSIQRIMKKYGVYVKFSNAEEFATLGGYLDNDDNVVARTPAKNAINLDNLKQSIMDLVNPKDKDFVAEKVAIPRKYHRTLLGEKSIFIHDIENKTNCKFRFPDKESASDIVAIFGPDSQVHIAATMLLDHVPFEAELAIPPNSELPRVCGSPDFLAFAERIKREFQVSIAPIMKSSTKGSPGTPGQCSFKFMCQRSNSDFLITARELLEQFLISQNIPVFPMFKTHRRADSFAESLPHFDSKLLSAAHGTPTMLRLSIGIGSLRIMADRRLRMASSSPDVKALFNSSSNTTPSTTSSLYQIEQEDFPDENDSVYDSPSADYWTPLPSINGGNPAARVRHLEDSYKRGSDSLLEAKLKEKFSKPRSLQNRAQSLDLTYSLSKITEAAHPPDSPTPSIPDDILPSEPPSATQPSFPSVYDRPPIQSSLHASSRTARILDDESVDEVSRVISNLGL